MQKQVGVDVGPCWFFYGARKAATEYLYREEFEKYEKLGVLHMRTAFSRDQARKIYVQHRIVESAEDVFRLGTLIFPSAPKALARCVWCLGETASKSMGEAASKTHLPGWENV